MSSLRGRPLLRRILAEHRRIIAMLAVVLAANAGMYLAVVRPLARQVATVEQRTQAAEGDLATARSEHAQATGTVTGSAQAAAELETFYTTVLPPSLSGARRMTLVRFAQLADSTGLEIVGRREYEPEAIRGSRLTRLKMRLTLAGTYADLRRFIHEIEGAREFIVIDHVELAEATGDAGPLVLSLELSTYFRTGS